MTILTIIWGLGIICSLTCLIIALIQRHKWKKQCDKLIHTDILLRFLYDHEHSIFYCEDFFGWCDLERIPEKTRQQILNLAILKELGDSAFQYTQPIDLCGQAPVTNYRPKASS